MEEEGVFVMSNLELQYSKTVVEFIGKYKGQKSYLDLDFYSDFEELGEAENSDLDFYSDFEVLGEPEKDELKRIVFYKVIDFYSDMYSWGNNLYIEKKIYQENYENLYEKIKECFESKKPTVFK